MGQEARCLARIGGRVVQVKALLESDELILRGEHRLRLPFAGLDRVEVADGRLTVQHDGEPIVLELGPAAERWAAKIRNPPTLLDKLGVKAGQEVAVIGVTDASLLALLGQRANVIETMSVNLDSVVHDVAGAEFDLIFAQVDSRQDFERLPIAAIGIAQHGAVWVLHPKGRPDLKDTDVIAAGKQAGLIDNKVARISDTHSALRFVVPKEKRRPTRSCREASSSAGSSGPPATRSMR